MKIYDDQATDRLVAWWMRLNIFVLAALMAFKSFIKSAFNSLSKRLIIFWVTGVDFIAFMVSLFLRLSFDF
ncbi:hypothetical protein BEL04_10540 [Mucilaginibacter sp. PPCGB 2223]|nr:hypothetical protein BEL04_10540 [Mucilaginibacter sp. PPCGB 2223]